MKIEEVVKKYQEEYLKDKSDEERELFFRKNVKRQYGNIQSWRRRSLDKAKKEIVPVEILIDNIRKTVCHVKNLSDISQKDLKNLTAEAALLLKTIQEYENIRRNCRIEELRRKQIELEKEISKLESQQKVSTGMGETEPVDGLKC